MAGSLLCSMAHSIDQLIAFRALQGLGASMLNPVALSIVANVFKDPRERARAIGGLGRGGGVLVGAGAAARRRVDASDWLAVDLLDQRSDRGAGGRAGGVFVPESKAARARAFDPVGQLLVFMGLTTLTYAVIEGPHAGWPRG